MSILTIVKRRRNRFVCLSIYVYVCLSVYLCVYLFVCLSLCLFVCLSICVFVIQEHNIYLDDFKESLHKIAYSPESAIGLFPFRCISPFHDGLNVKLEHLIDKRVFLHLILMRTGSFSKEYIRCS